jgi:hypothetical protein
MLTQTGHIRWSVFGLALTIASCRPRQALSTDTTVRAPATAARSSTSRPGPAPRQSHFVSPDEQDAAIARGPVPGFAGRLLEGCRRIILLTDTARQTAAARAYFASRFGGGCATDTGFTFRQVTYDFAQLYDWYTGPFRAVWASREVTSTDIDEQHNQIAVGVLNATGAARVQRILDTLPIPKGAVRVDPGVYACVGTGGPSVLVEVRDPYGRPAAFGTTIVIQDGTFIDSVSGINGDSLHVGAGNRRPGTYEVRLYKPGYERVVLHDVKAPGDTLCRYALPSDIRKVRLELRPGGPKVRSVVILSSNMSFGLPDLTAQLQAMVDADPGVSTAVTWSSSDTTVATITPTGLLRSRCRRTPGETMITAASVVDPRVRGHVSALLSLGAGAQCAR